MCMLLCLLSIIWVACDSERMQMHTDVLDDLMDLGNVIIITIIIISIRIFVYCAYIYITACSIIQSNQMHVVK